MHELLDPFHYVFMQHALVAVVLVGVTCAVLGVYVVLRQMAFLGDALAHTAMPGLAVAYLNGWNLFLGALVADLVAALGIGVITGRRDVREDTAIGIIFSGLFALGIAILSAYHSYADLPALLFGDVISVSVTELWLMAAVAVIVLVALAGLHKELELTSFDEGYARVIGLKPAWLRMLLLFLLAATVVSAIGAVGVVLTSAMLVTPAAAAGLLTRRLKSMMALATVIAVGSGVAGLYFSYFYNVSSGAAIVLACTLVFALIYGGKVLAQRLRRPAPPAPPAPPETPEVPASQ